MTHEDLIIGGGIAGSALAFALRQAGREAVVAEARPSHHKAGAPSSTSRRMV